MIGGRPLSHRTEHRLDVCALSRQVPHQDAQPAPRQPVGAQVGEQVERRIEPAEVSLDRLAVLG